MIDLGCGVLQIQRLEEEKRFEWLHKQKQKVKTIEGSGLQPMSHLICKYVKIMKTDYNVRQDRAAN